MNKAQPVLSAMLGLGLLNDVHLFMDEDDLPVVDCANCKWKEIPSEGCYCYMFEHKP